MMNQTANVARGPTGSTTTAGATCCPMFNSPFFFNSFAPQTPLIPPPQAQQCFLGPQATQLQIPSTPAQQTNASLPLLVNQQQPQHLQSSIPSNAHGQQQQQQRSQGQSSAHNTSISHALSLSHFLTNQNASNCMALAAALAQASFPHFQTLQQAQQPQQHQAPINRSTQPEPASGQHHHQQQQQQQIAQQAFQTSQSNGPARAALVPTADSYVSSGLNTANTTMYPPQLHSVPQNHHSIQLAAEPVQPVQSQQSSPPLTTQSQVQQRQQVPQPTQQQPQTAPPMPFYSFPQMDQALALLSNPQVANTIFSQVFSIYLRNNLIPDSHHTHHHHSPHHFHHHMHGAHHHHHHHHAPGGQSNGQDVTMPLDSLAISESKPRGLSRAEIDSLTPYIHVNEKDSRSCVICLSKFELKSKIRPLPCSHAFHAKCVDKWLRANRTCPICRRDALKVYNAKIKRI